MPPGPGRGRRLGDVGIHTSPLSDVGIIHHPPFGRVVSEERASGEGAVPCYASDYGHGVDIGLFEPLL